MTPSGLAQEKCVAHNRSRIAPTGKKKLTDVAVQIQYFVVALPRGTDVSAKAASETIDANIRWIAA
jgi:hypothetical protein